MKQLLSIIILLLFPFLNFSQTPNPGCTDSSASNYDSTAILDDGSCIWSYCGYKYIDNDCNCEYSDGDILYEEGWPIYLYNTSVCGLYMETITNADGEYCFDLNENQLNELDWSFQITEEAEFFNFDSNLSYGEQTKYSTCQQGYSANCLTDAPSYGVFGAPGGTYQAYMYGELGQQPWADATNPQGMLNIVNNGSTEPLPLVVTIYCSTFRVAS